MDIFITGATGFIGGSLAQSFAADGHSVRGLVRTHERAEELVRRGVVPVVGDLDDIELLAREAGRAEGVINAASALHLGAIQALVGGLSSGAKLLHTSGIGAYSVDVEGLQGQETVVDDTDLPPVGAHPMQRALRTIESTALNSGKHAIVLSNALVYGSGLGLTSQSIQVPMMVRAATHRGNVTVVGNGSNVWSTVHIEDLVDIYRLALEKAPAGAFYFVENGEASFASIGQAVSNRLALGEPRHLPLAEAADVYGEMPARYLLASSSRVRAERARRDLGWSPKRRSITDWIETEMPAGASA